ncbi:isoprenoid synthase domain-containing protein [Polychytrium aggregatum]|uniref:isoprenoid synthase domain-containing protein n=1 Tax=Polychytrium aggregatum TaxID=110093 RepID=UPI0022FE7413|nr:isoprenoid synthase domain-containing protein [Polychytrium aggregatum]KAI9203666.1 isoprenoid synthase domain-containing protein [Polychytrium aggregatum]
MAAKAFMASLMYPDELHALIKWKLSESKTSEMFADRSKVPPESDPQHNYALCYYYLNMCSRSFARVIQELDDELRHPVCIFYLVLRGLDTIEDDMTLDVKKKCDILRRFDQIIHQRGWNFQESGPNEADAPLVKEFEVVIEEFLSLKEPYQKVIADIAKRMGCGFADFCEGKKVVTIEDYNLYTHYAAGLVGLGLTGLFAASGLEDPNLDQFPDLANEMGLFLQKVNIIKDFYEDLQDGRRFWPKEIWEQYVPEGEDMAVLALPDNRERALACLNHMCADALKLVPSCLEYMSKLRNPSVIRFCAIPQLMAIATISLFFNNRIIFERAGLKIRRGLTVKLIFQSNTFDSIKGVYEQYAYELGDKNHAACNSKNPFDKSFIPIGTSLANIVKWIQINDAKLGVKRTRQGQFDYITNIGLILAIITLTIGFWLQYTEAASRTIKEL